MHRDSVAGNGLRARHLPHAPSLGAIWEYSLAPECCPQGGNKDSASNLESVGQSKEQPSPVLLPLETLPPRGSPLPPHQDCLLLAKEPSGM